MGMFAKWFEKGAQKENQAPKYDNAKTSAKEKAVSKGGVLAQIERHMEALIPGAEFDPYVRHCGNTDITVHDGNVYAVDLDSNEGKIYEVLGAREANGNMGDKLIAEREEHRHRGGIHNLNIFSVGGRLYDRTYSFYDSGAFSSYEETVRDTVKGDTVFQGKGEFIWPTSLASDGKRLFLYADRKIRSILPKNEVIAERDGTRNLYSDGSRLFDYDEASIIDTFANKKIAEVPKGKADMEPINALFTHKGALHYAVLHRSGSPFERGDQAHTTIFNAETKEKVAETAPGRMIDSIVSCGDEIYASCSNDRTRTIHAVLSDPRCEKPLRQFDSYGAVTLFSIEPVAWQRLLKKLEAEK